jgi:uracil phosphoribosyltransferase
MRRKSVAKVFQSNHPLIQHKLALVRDTTTEPKRFRELIRELAVLLACEATTDMELSEVTLTTPMGVAQGKILKRKVALVPILRAGLGMVDGIWEMIPSAEVWHIGIYRDHDSLEPVEYYTKRPVDPHVQLCLILDPMLATGGSAIAAADILKKWGARRIKFLGVIAAPEGVEALSKAHPDVNIHLAAVDERLNEIGYIVPGLGDAGDRQFGTG